MNLSSFHMIISYKLMTYKLIRMGNDSKSADANCLVIHLICLNEVPKTVGKNLMIMKAAYKLSNCFHKLQKHYQLIMTPKAEILIFFKK